MEIQNNATNFEFRTGDRWSIGQEFDGGQTTSDHLAGTIDQVLSRNSTFMH